MVTALVDSSIIIDLLRGFEPADQWLIAQTQLGLVRVVWIEVLQGAPNLNKQQQALKMLRRFELVELITDDLVWATEMLIKYGLSHNAKGYDCMIAAVSQRLNLPLFTHNLKHFMPLIGSLAVRPY